MKIRTLAAVAKVAAGEVAERVQSYLAPGNRHLPKITTKFQNNFGGDYERGNDVSRSREDAEKMSFFLRGFPKAKPTGSLLRRGAIVR